MVGRTTKYTIVLSALLDVLSPQVVGNRAMADLPRFKEVSMGQFCSPCRCGDGHAEVVSGRGVDQEGLFIFAYSASRWVKTAITQAGE